MIEHVVGMASELGAHAFMVSVQGETVISDGKTGDLFNVASIRKCFLSSLFGIRSGRGEIDISSSLSDLHIDDNPLRLSDREKQATIEDLLTLSSGVYHV